MLPVKRILCPTDFSEPSLAALDVACELAQHFDAELLVFHVLPSTLPIPTDLVVVPATGFYPSDHERCEESLRQVRNLIKHRVPNEVSGVAKVKVGFAPDEIVGAADESDVQMIVMGTHGTTGWRHLAFGSVTEKVVRAAHIPVLTVHSGQSRRPAETVPTTA